MLLDKKTSGASTFPGREPAFYEVPWIRNLIRLCGALFVIAVLYQAGVWISHYGTQVVSKEFSQPPAGAPQIALYADLKTKPAWLHKTIVDQILAETQDFAGRDQVTYDRLLNPLDKDVLAEIAANYTAVDAAGVNHGALRENAWIRRITEVRRVISKDKKTQTIVIDAEFRYPAAWVVCGGKCYLIDRDFVRLPGEYSPADRKATAGLMAITGLDHATPPEPSATWSGDDLAAGMKLLDVLQNQKYAMQIDAIDLTNFNGRKNPRESWIVLNTIWTAKNGSPRVVKWGRPVGDEGIRNVSVDAKLKVLNEIYLEYNRIDAGRDYVDIHGDQPQVPKLATQADDDGGARPTHG